MQPAPFEHRLSMSWPPNDWHDVTVLAAVSGGADSVALVRGLHAVRSVGRGRLIVAHFNHQLRGAESNADEAFVVALAHSLGLPFEVGRGDVQAAAAAAGDGVEAAARAARYEFLQATAERLGARYVATAHTADDQAETILHRIVRGTGLAGLAGMARARPLGPCASLIRPLLEFRRAEIHDYLASVKQPYRDDASNADPSYLRNRLRNELLPLLEARFNPDVRDALLRLGSLAGDAQQVIDTLADRLREECVTALPDGSLSIACRTLSTQSRHLIREILLAAWRSRGWPLQAMGQAQWELLADMVVGGANIATFPGSIRAERRGDTLYLRRV